MKRPLGCLSPLGVLAVLVVLASLMALTLAKGPIVFSAGPLNAVSGAQTLGGIRSHAELAGRCAACHVAPWSAETMADLCLGCHRDVAAQIGDRTGLHGGLLAPDAARTCRGCHTEHKGPIALLTAIDVATFPHDLTGYSLRGHQRTVEGAKVACADCHGQDLAHFDQAVCQRCHAQIDASFIDQHAAVFGPQCVPCHDGADRYGADFDHDQLAFRLVGKHAGVSCAKCHPDARSVQALRGTAQDCFACHHGDDTHQGQLGQQCGSCHTPEDWKKATFDHSTSAFPLTGAHISVPCEQCHRDGVLQGTPQDCFTCHSGDDAHQGRFGQQCGSCHLPANWKTATFDHDKSTFPLTGAHASLKCEQCHRDGVLKGAPQDCFGCHSGDDAHQGQFGQQCQGCHTPADWKQATFDHSKSAFPLTGAHISLQCEQCHRDGVLKGAPKDCFACHSGGDAHQGQFGQQCEGCHTPEDWKNASFDHSKSAFPLTGAHASLKCEQCHRNNVFLGTPQDCFGCHPEPTYHAGAFGNQSTQCATCHNTTAYAPAQFNLPHTFPTNHGERGENRCTTCHPDTLRVYTCYAGCHEHNQARTEAQHAREGITNLTDCAHCHQNGREEGGGD